MSIHNLTVRITRLENQFNALTPNDNNEVEMKLLDLSKQNDDKVQKVTELVDSKFSKLESDNSSVLKKVNEVMNVLASKIEALEKTFEKNKVSHGETIKQMQNKINALQKKDDSN